MVINYVKSSPPGGSLPIFNTHDVRVEVTQIYESWNFNSDNYLFTTDTK